MPMMGMRGGWQSPESGMKKDTLWGAYCYREIDQQISGVSRIENLFTELPLRQGEQMIYYVLADKCTSSLQLFLSTEKKAQPLLSVTVKEVNTGKVVARKQIKTKFSGGQARTYVMQMTKLPSKS